MNKLTVLIAFFLPQIIYSISITGTAISTVEIPTTPLFLINSFNSTPSSIIGNDSVVFVGNIINVGNLVGSFNSSIWIPDTNETLNISINTTLLSGETVQLFKLYSSNLSIGNHSIYLYVNSTNVSVTSASGKYVLTVNAATSNTVNIIVQSTGGSGGGGGQPIISQESPSKALTELNKNNPIGDKLLVGLYPITYYQESTPGDGFNFDFHVKSDGTPIDFSSVKLKGIPKNWKYGIVKKTENTFEVKITPSNQQEIKPEDYGTYPIEVSVDGLENKVTTIARLFPKKETGILRTVETDPVEAKPKITLTFYNNENKPKIINIIENIPKAFAESTDLIDFDTQPIILSKDPKVQWEVYLKNASTKKISYKVKKPIKKLEENYSNVFKSFISEAQVISSNADLGNLLASIYTPNQFRIGETQNLKIILSNTGLNQMEVTINLKIPQGCISNSSEVTTTMKPRSEFEVNVPMTCTTDAPPGNYNSNIQITSNNFQKNYDFNFILFKQTATQEIKDASKIITIIMIIIILGIMTGILAWLDSYNKTKY